MEDCSLCYGSGEVTILSLDSNETKTVGCPLCIQTELEQEISELKDTIAEYCTAQLIGWTEWDNKRGVEQLLNIDKHNLLMGFDILFDDGTILSRMLPQNDGDLYWEGIGYGEQFIDPTYTNLTHWRVHVGRQ